MNRNDIIMVIREHHYVINIGTVSNFYISIDISIDPAYPGSLAKGLLEQVNSEDCGFSLFHRSSSPLSTMIFDWA